MKEDPGRRRNFVKVKAGKARAASISIQFFILVANHRSIFFQIKMGVIMLGIFTIFQNISASNM